MDNDLMARRLRPPSQPTPETVMQPPGPPAQVAPWDVPLAPEGQTAPPDAPFAPQDPPFAPPDPQTRADIPWDRPALEPWPPNDDEATDFSEMWSSQGGPVGPDAEQEPLGWPAADALSDNSDQSHDPDDALAPVVDDISPPSPVDAWASWSGNGYSPTPAAPEPVAETTPEPVGVPTQSDQPLDYHEASRTDSGDSAASGPDPVPAWPAEDNLTVAAPTNSGPAVAQDPWSVANEEPPFPAQEPVVAEPEVEPEPAPVEWAMPSEPEVEPEPASEPQPVEPTIPLEPTMLAEPATLAEPAIQPEPAPLAEPETEPAPVEWAMPPEPAPVAEPETEPAPVEWAMPHEPAPVAEPATVAGPTRVAHLADVQLAAPQVGGLPQSVVLRIELAIVDENHRPDPTHSIKHVGHDAGVRASDLEPRESGGREPVPWPEYIWDTPPEVTRQQFEPYEEPDADTAPESAWPPTPAPTTPAPNNPAPPAPPMTLDWELPALEPAQVMPDPPAPWSTPAPASAWAMTQQAEPTVAAPPQFQPLAPSQHSPAARPHYPPAASPHYSPAAQAPHPQPGLWPPTITPNPQPSDSPAATADAEGDDARTEGKSSPTLTAGLTIGFGLLVVVLVLVFIQLMTSLLR